jgi:hypothetical protein
MPGSVVLFALLLTPQGDERVVLDTSVPCYAAQTQNAEVVTELSVASELSASREPTDDGWLLTVAPGVGQLCWVSADATTSLDRNQPEVAFLAVVDHVLATREGKDFADFVQVHNLFIPWNPMWTRTADVSSSPILSLRRAEIVDAALSTISLAESRDEPLIQSFVLSQGSTIRYSEPAGRWHVYRAFYRDIYRRFADSPQAEDLLWAAAHHPPYNACENSISCRLERPLESVATYWVQYPNGRFVAEAVELALEQLGALANCRALDPEAATPRVVADLLATLENVDPARKSSVVALLESVLTECS